MIWEFIYSLLKGTKSIEWADKYEHITSEEVIGRAVLHGQMLKKKLPAKSRCAVLCERELNTAISILSCWYAGMIPVPMSKNYSEKHCVHIVDYITPDCLISDSARLYTYDIPFYNITTLKYENEKNNFNADSALSDVAVIMCTSGTTGVPKGAMITEDGLIRNVINISKYFSVISKDKILIARPLYHCAVLTGEFLLSMYKGLDILFFDETYNPSAIVNLLERENIKVMCGTPTLFNHISALYKRLGKTSNLNTTALSGECLTGKIAANIRSCFPNTSIYNVYGLTEAAPRISWLSPELFDTHPESVGIPLEETTIKIADSSNLDHELIVNERGIILVKSPSVMKGYYRNEKLSQKRILDGWLNTGDIGYKDENGLLYICSREDDLIIKAGMNIYPQEIENAVRQIGIVDDVVVYGIKNDSGQSIGINIALKNFITKKEILTLFSEILPSYQMPDTLNIVNDIEKNASGKAIRPRT